MTQRRRYRVAQWATGNVGARSLRQVIEHPDMDLVGVWVHGEDKVGRDAGELAGLAPIGVRATSEIDDIVATRPDCVLYMPHACDYAAVRKLLEAGINIVTTRMEFQNLRALNPAEADLIEEACRRGASSIHASGASPGFISEALPIVLLSLQRRFHRLQIEEYADCSSRDSPDMIFGMMGFGSQPAAVADAQLDHAYLCFAPSLRLLAKGSGVLIDDIRVTGAQGIARRDIAIAAGIVPKGTVAATRTTVTATSGHATLMQFTTTWFVSEDVDTDDGETWAFRSPSGWHVRIDGDCPIAIDIGFPVDPEDYADMTPGLTANRPINAIPYVCEAPPGIRTILDLPQILARFER